MKISNTEKKRIRKNFGRRAQFIDITVNSRLPRFSLGAFLHAEIMKMSVSGAKTVPKSGKSYEDLCFAMFA